MKDRGLFTILTSWKRTNNVIRDEIDVATKAAAGKKAISSITESLIEQLKNVSLTADEKRKKGMVEKQIYQLKKNREKNVYASNKNINNPNLI